MRALPWFCLLLTLCATGPAVGADRYGSTVIVTGMDARERQEGLSRALAEVLFKASGNPAWLTDGRVRSTPPGPLVISIVYLDRESNLPKHDEQGTRDRPYDLFVRFDPARIDTLLRGWDDAPWVGPRPTLAVELVITPRNGTPVAARADTDPDEPHRGALLAAADRAGLELLLPLRDGTQRPGPAGPILHGTVTWSSAAFGWVSAWTLSDGPGLTGPAVRWGLSGVSFDAAYRDGMEGAARILSHHGEIGRPSQAHATTK